MRKLLVLSGIVAALIMTTSAWGYSDGSRLNRRTGAPGESTCANCHDNLNTGSGSITINAPSGYAPGDTLDVTVTIQNQGQQRWGFEFTALDGSNLPVGQLLVTDAARTVLSSGGGKEYINHTQQGTDAGTANQTSWSFRWAAPETPVSSVTFYTAGIAANNSGNTNGDSTYSTTHTMIASAADDDLSSGLPDNFRLAQNYPNPFNPTTTIKFTLPKSSHVRLTVFNVMGQQIQVLADRSLSAGTHTIDWDGSDSNGSRAASGIYYYRLETDDYSQTKEMILVK